MKSNIFLLNMMVLEGKQKRVCKRGFTLLELLIVIGIISILVSILLPSLQKARYNTIMAVCASNLAQANRIHMLYAATNDQNFVYRNNVRGVRADAYSPPSRLRHGTHASVTNDAPLFDELGLWDLGCPFPEQQSYDKLDPLLGLNGTGSTGVGYSHYAGWQGNKDKNLRLFKTTDTMEWGGDEFNILVSDQLSTWHYNSWFFNSHYSLYQKMSSKILYWSIGGDRQYSVNIDNNFSRLDGSNLKIQKINIDDSRLKRLPYTNGGNENTRRRSHLLPPAD
jgi:prepilin-type N-terminal cleavage/methylation domain-containing protein